MGKHEHQGVRMKRAAAKAAARRERKQRIREMRYAFNDAHAESMGYDNELSRPSTPRPHSGVIALRNMEALRSQVPPPEKPPDTLTSKSWKYLNTCFGIMAVALVGVGVLVGVTGHWTTSNAGTAGIALICVGVGVVVFLVIVAYVRLRHAKMRETRREKKKAKADAEKGELDVKKGEFDGEEKKRPKTAPDLEGGLSVQIRPTSSRQGKKKKRAKSAAGGIQRLDGDADFANSAIDASDTKNILPRSESRNSMNPQQGSANMTAIPEDREEGPPATPVEGFSSLEEEERVATPPGTVMD
ncbi:uncharacterized protein [Diadema antillarum]|uniref:uncharacterized protein n=1 Tax=Diadema antillarum TaxID=105358 RepID=UPI003A8AC3BD